MVKVLICCAKPNEKNELDQELVYWADYCVPRLSRELHDAGENIRPDLLTDPDLDAKMVREAVANNKPDLLVVYGFSRPSGETNVIHHRRKPLQRILVDDSVLTAACHIPLVINSAFSYAYFRDHISRLKVPEYIGFNDNITVPTLGSTSRTGLDYESPLLDAFTCLYTEPAIALAMAVDEGNDTCIAYLQQFHKRMENHESLCKQYKDNAADNQIDAMFIALKDSYKRLHHKVYRSTPD